MKTMWKLASIFAVVNLLALLGAGAWLMMTGRLDRERFDAVKVLLAAPMSAAKPEAKAETIAEELRDTTATGVRISAQDRANRQVTMNLRRLHDEREQLARGLVDEESTLARRTQELAAEKKAWDDLTLQAKEQANDGQFRKAVKMLESVPPKQAKEWLLALCAQGHIEQAVAYLDAMTAFKSSGVMKTFKGDAETKLATDLLERLRQRAQASPATADDSGQAPNAPSDAPTSPARGSESAQSKPIANAGAEIDAQRPGTRER
ncbi:MAG: hypothetical protein SGJ09_10985 [Phycisphaerae bacterium]|nr:hypothetical protein [Phycisphaerae bacterium]